MLHSIAAAFLAACAAQAPADAPMAPGTTLERDPAGGLWIRADGRRYAVDPTTVSVKLRPGHAIAAVLASAGAGDPALAGLAVARSNRLGVHDVTLAPGQDPAAVGAALRARPDVEFAELNAVGEWHAVPNDPRFNQQYHLNNTGQTGGTADADIDAPEAWDIEDGDPSVVIAIVDSGTQLNHPDLAAGLWTNSGEIPGNLVDDDSNGFVDDNQGWDFGSNDNVPGPDYPHGTWVAGVAAAPSNNGKGVCGVAGGAADGAGCKMMIVSLGPFPSSAILDDAILYAVDNGARVITMSLGLPQATPVDLALQAGANQDVFVDCSAGNGGGVSYPASNALVMAVGGTDHNDGSGFFSHGPLVEVAAASTGVYTTAVNGLYEGVDGTSFASPQVAGLAGLLFSLDPSLTAPQVRALIRANADDVYTPGKDDWTGDGRINARRTLEAVATVVLPVVEFYGAPTAGTTTPVIGTNGVSPVVGSAGFGITLAGALPSAAVWLVLGAQSAATPFLGGTLLVSPVPVFIVTAATANAGGGLTLAGNVPNTESLAGSNVYMQWLAADPGALAGLAFSRGLHVVIGS